MRHVPPTAKHPAERLIPFAKEEEATELEVSEPPVKEMPLLDWSPPPPTVKPPVKVFVALTVETKEPPAIVTPPVVTLRSSVCKPPAKVFVATLV